jgi:hypothetical protein
MPLVELSEDEHFIIEVIRQFAFLNEYGFKITGSYSYYDEVGLKYFSKEAKREIEFSWIRFNGLRFNITHYLEFHPKVLFNRKLYTYFNAEHLDVELNSNNYCEIIKKNAEFAKEKILSIIKGEEWIDSIEHEIRNYFTLKFWTLLKKRKKE